MYIEFCYNTIIEVYVSNKIIINTVKKKMHTNMGDIHPGAYELARCLRHINLANGQNKGDI